MSRAALLSIVLVSALLSSSLPAGAQQRSGALNGARDIDTSRYRLRPGDSFDLAFPFASTFNQTVTVQPDGYVSLRIIGEVHVAGVTVSDIVDTVGARYADTLRDPRPTIVLRDFEKPYFVAAGEVERPGKYDLRGETTLTQALAIAGGFKDRAKRSHVIVVGRGLDGSQGAVVHEVDARKMLEGRDEGSVLHLKPGDLVFVSKTRIPSMATLAGAVLPNLGWIAYALASRP